MAISNGIFLKDLPRFEADMVRVLKKLGLDAMKHAYLVGHSDAARNVADIAKTRKYRGSLAHDRKWRHKLGNLHDSFASAVYVNGSLVKTSVKYLGGTISKMVDPRTLKTGRQTVQDYLNKMHFGKTNNQIVLVVVAAMFYTKWLESGYAGNVTEAGGGETNYRYIVVSPAKKYIAEHYRSAVEPIYNKYGIPTKDVKARVIKGVFVEGVGRSSLSPDNPYAK